MQGCNIEDILLAAAHKITRSVEDLLSERRIRRVPLHVYVIIRLMVFLELLGSFIP